MNDSAKGPVGPTVMLPLSERQYQLLRYAMDDHIDRGKARIRTCDEVRDEIESGSDTIHLSKYAKELRDKLMAACNHFAAEEVATIRRLEAEADRLDAQVRNLGWRR